METLNLSQYSKNILEIRNFDEKFTEYYKLNCDSSIETFSGVKLNDKRLFVPNLKLSLTGLVLLIPQIDDNLILELENRIKTIMNTHQIESCSIVTFILNKLTRNMYIKTIPHKFTVIHNNNIEYYQVDNILTKEINGNKKRKSDQGHENKKRKSDQGHENIQNNKLDERFISPSSLRNFCYNDVLLDYFDMTYKKGIPSNELTKLPKKKNTDNVFLSKIFQHGNDFETYIVNELKKEFNVVTITTDARLSRDVIFFDKTKEEMSKGSPIIYQGVLHNYENNTFGCCDLLIRSDFVNKVFKCQIFDTDEQIIGSIFNSNYHYIACDVKFQNLTNKYSARYPKYLLNDVGIKYPKLQLCLYSQALGYIQNYYPTKALVIGKNNQRQTWDFGIVDFNNDLSIDYPNKLKDGIKTIQKLRQTFTDIKLLPQPSLDCLRPNMSSKNDGGYGSLKKQYALKIFDPTLIYYIGPKERDMALQHGITSYLDPRLNSSIIGKKGTKVGARIDNILTVNRSDNFKMIPNELNNFNDWRNYDDYFYVYIDFEYFNNVFSKQVFESNNMPIFNDLIFMIGLGWIEDGEWTYKNLTISQLSIKEENVIASQMISILNQLSRKMKKSIKLVHYNHTEKTEICNLYERFNLRLFHFEYVDIYKVLLDNNFAVNGSYNYSLKSIVNAFNKHGKINCTWDNSIDNGMKAMTDAYTCYISSTNPKNTNLFKEIIKYNEIDCKSMYELIKYLNINH
jgi:hypothetical protein